MKQLTLKYVVLFNPEEKALALVINAVTSRLLVRVGQRGRINIRRVSIGWPFGARFEFKLHDDICATIVQ